VASVATASSAAAKGARTNCIKDMVPPGNECALSVELLRVSGKRIGWV
jgi:hypothetical protein